ncbi:MAG: M61 family peptidase [Mongoliibacter sp.]|uniref:M61 family metallopeptidase n=1 Tax=Mongoliibacter sp. TaxID=2022438 RepID=UPI0012F1FEBC|nr:M61 family peptidase [Mongoliibacter sp.]TVP43063.1 MAG: M61 family peptidase [Mongoliibacter sp.]
MKYFIKRESKVSQFIQIVLHIPCEQNETITLQLAAWRPGRYELTNFAKNIRSFDVFSNGEKVAFQKISKDRWIFTAHSQGEYKIHYEYYCATMNAGSCWSDDELLYLNFSNFIFEVQGREKESIDVSIDIPKTYKIATPLPMVANNTWKANGYQHIMDSPWTAGKNISNQSYKIASSKFHLWWVGDVQFNSLEILEVFKGFTKKMMEDFGGFPADDYHFIFLLLPYQHYHGVEHQFSTVITIGPASKLAEGDLLKKLIGVSSHELYHFWNVCRIRPKELLEYDLSKETYLDTGFILEGITTYMGDYYLLTSGYFSQMDYLKILENQIQKESDNLGWTNESIVESSFNLWLDGYTPGIPEDKVNIYNRGALISFCLDVSLKSDNSGLQMIMKEFWELFGKTGKGYKLYDFLDLVRNYSEKSFMLLNKLLFEKIDIIPFVKTALNSSGIALDLRFEDNTLLHELGIRVNENRKIIQVHPDSKAYSVFMIGDELLLNNDQEPDPLKNFAVTPGNMVKVKRYERIINLPIENDNSRYFPKVSLSFSQYTL